ncbi:anaphase-promoting complex subunit 4 isoform X1 [Cricetulus griseus]|uniref:Anaphase-promoting complex subunit 4 n=1 Tax=Cricetulus griseus TaxID=10029 RepID=A0A061IP22_CRIGR|nr:anaphase-promoting complex subunit 4 isoform X1 [Cricetulus griseus]XP_027242755.1 anaphase-promoting complex subunit 4 isoform X1 [Cricetulus griseus]ERE91306.1 anaphase-promoting complex subunit 4 isoform 1 [Cricetulus griseus]
MLRFPTCFPSFRVVGEKQLPQEIVFLCWSPKRDLIALANTTGEVLLHRLASFHRVWSFPPNENTGKEVTCLAWRPDGKLLAFALADTKKIILCDVEKPESLHSFSVEAPVSCMHWMEVTVESSVLTSFYNAEDESNLLLPKLPTLPKNYSNTSKIFSEENSDEIIKLLGDVRLNILVLGGSSGFIELYAYGMFKIARVTGIAGTCLALCLSSDLKSLSVVTEVSSGGEAEVSYFQLETNLLYSFLPEVTRMARKFTHISALLQYINLSLTCMCEAWEEILMQMDSRLTKFVQEKTTTTSVQDEFMHLLLWGKASAELQTLLMNQLTVKGLKKLGQSIESSYSSIQKLVISHLQSGSESLLYHLSELKGMASWKQKYEPLGLDATGIEDAITAVGSFILKANELLQVIDSSMKNFKAFFRWLYVAMLRMTEDHVLPELNKMTQKDITFVAEFLTEHFNEAPDLYNRKGKYFNVERVGQYLKDEDDDLVSPPNTEGNQWYDFLQNSSHLKESPLLFPYYPRKSLHFVKRRMENIIDQCLQKPADVIGRSMNQAICIPLYRDARSMDSARRLLKFPFLWNNKTSNLHYLLFTILEDSVYKMCILRRHTDISQSVNNGLIGIKFGSFTYATAEKVRRSRTFSSSTYSCLDAQFYDDETVTVILKDSMGREGRDRILVQLPLSLVYNSEDAEEYQFTGTYSTRLDEQGSIIPTRTMHFEKHWRLLESMKAQYVAGNGLRKVSCVLSSNLRHVRVFEMDIDDEWELDESSDDEEEAGGKPMKIKEEVLSESESESETETETEAHQDAAALDPDIVIKVEKLDPELDS